MFDLIRKRFTDKSIVLLGFGREGQSSYTLLRKIFPFKELAIADADDRVRENPLLGGDSRLTFITGPDYLSSAGGFDAIFRSPGIPVWNTNMLREQLTSQTEIFLEYYAKQVIGVTGTKGKSTTSSLIHHIFKSAGRDVLLAGNIGNPVFHFVDIINPGTVIVVELSSHQLEFLKKSPHIAVLLNLYQEHLDAYENYDAYKFAKINITKYQQKSDCIVFNADDPEVCRLVKPYLPERQGYSYSLSNLTGKGAFICDGYVCFSDGSVVVPVWKIHQDRFLRGEHNLKNIMAAVNVAMVSGITPETIEDGIATFKGLEHRLEYVGEFGNIHFYNDSIATIPEATMEAIKAVPNVDTLIAGGFDRGIDYAGLAAFLGRSQVRNVILIGAAGRRIMEHLTGVAHKGLRIFHITRFDDFKEIAFRETRAGYACLLSPAAASYDEFKNFEERGKRFRELVTASG